MGCFVVQQTKLLPKIQEYLYSRLGRAPSDQEVAETLDSLYYLGQAMNRYVTLSQRNRGLVSTLLSTLPDLASAGREKRSPT